MSDIADLTIEIVGGHVGEQRGKVVEQPVDVRL